MTTISQRLTDLERAIANYEAIVIHTWATKQPAHVIVALRKALSMLEHSTDNDQSEETPCESD
jgi:hypothetical protein